jgi:hypothetical protein
METLFLSEFCSLFKIENDTKYILSIGAKKQEQDTYIPIGKILKGSLYEGKILAISSPNVPRKAASFEFSSSSAIFLEVHHDKFMEKMGPMVKIVNTTKKCGKDAKRFQCALSCLPLSENSKKELVTTMYLTYFEQASYGTMSKSVACNNGKALEKESNSPKKLSPSDEEKNPLVSSSDEEKDQVKNHMVQNKVDKKKMVGLFDDNAEDAESSIMAAKESLFGGKKKTKKGVIEDEDAQEEDGEETRSVSKKMNECGERTKRAYSKLDAINYMNQGTLKKASLKIAFQLWCQAILKFEEKMQGMAYFENGKFYVKTQRGATKTISQVQMKDFIEKTTKHNFEDDMRTKGLTGVSDTFEPEFV